jgi:hypothetical protein
MALADFQPASHEVKLQGGSFRVMGLSLTSISRLVEYHLDDLEALFNFLKNADKIKADADMRPIALALVQHAPGLVANIIALAAGEPDSAKQAEQIPAPIQVDLLMKIGDLTFTEAGGVKKSLEMVATLLGEMRAAKPTLMETVAKAE